MSPWEWHEAATTVTLGDGRRLHGFVDEGFGGLMDVFVDNFEVRHDVGSACVVMKDGRIVADMWGGIADRRTGRPWTHDTMAVTFSCTKGILAICAYLLVQDGRLDLDLPVAHYWPEFGQAGKEGITVRHAMSHRAGLPSLDVDLTRTEVLAWDPVISAIETATPQFSPDEGFAYHAMTYGWIVGEVIRRITAQSPGTFFRAAIGDPLELDTWIGVPEEARLRVAHMEPPLLDADLPIAREAVEAAAANPVVERSLTMGGAFAFPDDDGEVTFNDPAIQRAEIPGANGISTARSITRLYASCTAGVDGVTLLAPSTLADALVVRSEGAPLTGMPDDGARWGTGFQLSSPPLTPMLGPRSFGHAGAGGQLAFADADTGVAFGFLSSQMGGYGDARARELILHLRNALGT